MVSRPSAKPQRAKAIKRKAPKKVAKPIFVTRFASLLKNLKTYVESRKKKYGGSDTVSRKLNTVHTSLGRESRKKNLINPSMTKYLHHITSSLKGVPNVPQSLRMSVPKFLKFIREYVRKDVINCINGMKKMLTPMQNDMKKLEKQLQGQLKKAKTGKIQFKVDPSIKRKCTTLNNKIAGFKSKWNQRLNSLSLHGNRNVKNAVKSLKKQFEDLQKSVRRNHTIINRYAKAAKPKKGFRTQMLFNANQAKSFEGRWDRLFQSMEKCRISCENCTERLKAIK